jgi:hypothetical protein
MSLEPTPEPPPTPDGPGREDAPAAKEPAADLGPLAAFAGTWRGEGRGTYPTIEDFDYGEEIVLRDVGRPFLAYAQRTWARADGRPLHAETGYWRAKPGGRVELVIAQATGMVEIDEGGVDGGRIEVASLAVASTSTGPDVTRVTRTFALTVDGDELCYELRMEAVGQPLLVHLVATLRRAEERS